MVFPGGPARKRAQKTRTLCCSAQNAGLAATQACGNRDRLLPPPHARSMRRCFARLAAFSTPRVAAHGADHSFFFPCGPVPPQEGPGRTHYNPHLPGLQAGKSSFRPGAQDGVRRILRRTPLNTVQRFLLKISKIWLHPSSSMGSSAAAGGVWTGSDPAFPLWAGAASCSAFFSPAAVKGLLFIAPG